MSNIGQQIRQERRRLGLTQAQLASHLGVDNSTISKYESNVSQPDLNTMERIAQYFQVPIDVFMSERSIRGANERDPHMEVSSDIPNWTQWETIAKTLADALKMREETDRAREENERLRIEKVEAIRAEAELLAQNNIRKAMEAANPHSVDRSDEEAVERAE